MQTALTYRPGIDGLRCIAILWVIWHNAGNTIVKDEGTSAFYIRALDVALGSGWLGVQLFFVISGYLVTLILIRARTGTHPFFSFFARRVLRIFPIYFVFLALMVFVVPPLLSPHPLWIDTLLSNQVWYWTYTMNWLLAFKPDLGLPHLWSLAVEEQFYLFWPFAVLWLPYRLLPFAFAMAIAIATVTRTWLILGDEPWMAQAAYVWTVCRLDALAAGGLLAFYLNSERKSALLIMRALFVAGAISAFVVLAVEHRFGPRHDGISLFNQSIACILFVGLLGCVVLDDKPFYLKWLQLPPAVWIGRVSYAAYLFHQPVFLGWFSLALIPTTHAQDSVRLVWILSNLAVVSLLTLLLATFSWFALEKPVLNFKRYFQY